MRILAIIVSCLLLITVISCVYSAPMSGSLWGEAAPQGKHTGTLPETMMDLGASVGEASEGILLADVRPDGPAGLAGLRNGDVLVEQDGRPLAGMHPLEFLRNPFYVRLGAPVEFKILRDSTSFTRKVICGTTVTNLAKLTAAANAGLVAPATESTSASPTTPVMPPADASNSSAPLLNSPVRSSVAATPRPPMLGLTALNVSPLSVPTGAKFTIEVAYAAPSDKPVTFSFTISAGGRELFASKPEEIECGNGAPMLHARTIRAASEPGTYRIRVRLAQEEQAVERSVTLTVTARAQGGSGTP